MNTDRFSVFTYGSLMYAPVWQQVVRGSYHSCEATVHGFRRLRVRDESYPVLVVAANERPLSGRMYYDVSAADVERLDKFETDAYARVAIAAHANGTIVAAQAYLGLHVRDVLDDHWLPDVFERTGMRSFLASYAPRHIPTDNA